MNGETQVGGVMQLPDEAKQQGAPPHWLAYVAVPSVDDTLRQAERLGAKKLVGPMDIPTVGRIAVLQDPQGAVFAVYTPSGDAPGHDGVPAVGEFSWHELATSDYAAAFEFYTALYGWVKTEAMDMGPGGGTYQMFGRIPGRSIGGMSNKPADQPGPPASWLYYVTVPDVHAKVEQVKQLGGQVLNGPMEVPGGDFVAQCMDPQGAAFAIHSLKPFA
jgi:predicted enzyme related to lactoylglutathione lyase